MKNKTILLIILSIFINVCVILIYDKFFNNVKNFNRITLRSALYRNEDVDKIDLSRQTAITEAVKNVTPTVVSINAFRHQVPVFNPSLDSWGMFFMTEESHTVGSGIILSSDGYIVTMAHVIDNASQIIVILHNGNEFNANIIGVDVVHDIAILKINARNLQVAQLGTSRDLMIGEWTISIGNPYGYLMKDSKPSVSVGVVSAVDRNFNHRNDSRVFRGLIQTDAAINPGNSGGPLVNILSEIIGINAFIFTETGENSGVSFAIPIDRVKRSADEIIRYGRIREAYFGFRFQELTSFISAYLNLRSTDGVIISNVDITGPAQTAGLRRGDVIRMIDDTVIKDASDVELAITGTAPGDSVKIIIVRDGREMDIELITEAYP